MHSEDTSVSRIDKEKVLLRVLCASNEDIAQRRKLFQKLTQYSWRDNDHRVLFEALGELLTTAPQQILTHLPAALTRLGFPDISCDALANPSDITAAAAFALADELLRASQ